MALPAVGAPQLATGFQVVLPILAIADVVQTFFGPLQWGLFKDGAPAITADNVVGFEYRNDWIVSQYPLEEGGFESYDRVATPFDVRIRFSVGSGPGGFAAAIGGAEAARQAFLEEIKDAANTLDLFDVHTPEVNYSGCSVVHYDYRRESHHGATLLIVDVWLTEVRVTATAAFTSTASPSGADPESVGTVPNLADASPTETALGLGAS